MHMMGAGVTAHHKDWIPSRVAHTGTGPAPLGCSGHQAAKGSISGQAAEHFCFCWWCERYTYSKEKHTTTQILQGTKEELDTWFYRGGFLLAPIPTTALMLQQCPRHGGSGAVWGCQQLPPAGAWCRNTGMGCHTLSG